mmetsp:Transcript_27969/g.82243  ORF Transcript_27969/g.82243 Transcript_27969/m.82243 type:complete len:324 (-) Transcript_27969:492-1463(-)
MPGPPLSFKAQSKIEPIHLVQTILSNPLRRLFCIVGEDNISPCPLEACESLQYNILLLQPSFFTRRLNHGVFAGHMVGRNREGSGVLQAADHVEVGHAGLHHEHVGALGMVEGSLDECLPPVRWILLVCLLVSEARVAVQSVTERAVVCRSVLSRVGKDGHIGETLRVEGIADGADTAVLFNVASRFRMVRQSASRLHADILHLYEGHKHDTHHHITWGDNIGTSLGLGNGLLAQLVNGDIVQDLAILNNTIVTLVGVRVKGHIRAHHAVWVLLLNHTNGSVDNTVGVVSLHAEVRLKLIWDLGEEHKGFDSKLIGLANLFQH